MPNLYGVANPLPLPQFNYTPVNTSFPAGVETTVFQNTLVAPSQGVFYPVIFGFLVLTMGATPPSVITVGARVQSGSDFQSVSVPNYMYVASQTFLFPVLLWGPPSLTIYQNPGAVIQLTIAPGAQAVTLAASGPYVNMFLFRAPDQ